jgi:carbamoyltransferase
VGFLYAKITELCGYDWVLGEEGKVMGLAPYGKLNHNVYRLLHRLYKFKNGNLSIASRSTIQTTFDEIQSYARTSKEPFEHAANIAHTGQQVFCEILLHLLDDLSRLKLSRNLIVSGGCALNSSFNGSIIERTEFDNLYVPSAPGDDGNSIGAAFLAYHADHPECQASGRYQSPYLGSSISHDALSKIGNLGGSCRVEHLSDEIFHRAAKLLSAGKVIGWIQGRAEFGPRALGNRSILADPRRRDIKEVINLKVKCREAYRPFAPSILHEYGHEYFENYQESPYMERTLRYRESVISKIPGVVHVDRTGRVQTVKQEWNAYFYRLISAFHQLTGVPLVLNTSFNIMGRPIIHSLEDAIGMFYTSGLDAIVINDYMIEK